MPPHEQIESIGPQNNTGEEGDRARKKVPIITELVPPPPSYSEPKYRPDQTPWYKTMFELAAILIAIGLLIVNYHQQQSTERAANAAKDSVDLARKNAHFDQGAWLAISYGKLHFMAGQPFVFPVEIVDTGKTPAKRIQGEMVTLFLNRTDRLEFNYDRGTSLEIGTMLPNEPHHAPSWLIATKLAPGEKIAALPMSKQMVDAIRSGEAYVVVYGRLSYRSVFGTEHWIHFCGLNETPMQFSQKECTEYNDVDDNEEK